AWRRRPAAWPPARATSRCCSIAPSNARPSCGRMRRPMDDETERLNRLLDDLAAERDPRDRADLSAGDVELAQTAAFLKAARGERSAPAQEFVDRLGKRLAAASSPKEQARR